MSASRGLLVLALVLTLLLAGCTAGAPRGQTQHVEPVKASFTASPGSAAVGVPVTFQDTSQGAVAERRWDFGDGASTTQKANPIHTFDKAGVFTVRLDIKGKDGSTDSFQQPYVVGTTATEFTVDFDWVATGLTVTFTQRIQPATAQPERIVWVFGDGAVSDKADPTHTYAKAGVYTVALRVVVGIQVAEKIASVVAGQGPSTGLSEIPFTVIAIVDTGINPYHEEFIDPRFTESPSRYITGYPDDAKRLDITLGASQYTKAVQQDTETWKGVKANTLYWIPGTKIVGAISVTLDGSTRILDDDGHGTATASIAAGQGIGSCPDCLIVVVEGLGEAPLRWALDQPWIDVVSNSWSSQLCVSGLCPVDTNLLPPPSSLYGVDPGATKRAVEAGKTVLFASGNGMLNAFDSPQVSYLNAYSGPDWIVTVGAADAQTDATIVGTGRPVDIVAFGLNWKGASHTSLSAIESFGGTSAATPLAAGVFAYTILGARKALNDTREGPRGAGIVAQGQAVGPAGSLIADGKLTRAELQEAVFKTARSGTRLGPIYPVSLPGSAAAFLYAGWGLVDATTAKESLAVALGTKPMPTRTADAAWAQVDSAVRQAIWGSWNPGEAQALPYVGPLNAQDVDTIPKILEIWLQSADYSA